MDKRGEKRGGVDRGGKEGKRTAEVKERQERRKNSTN